MHYNTLIIGQGISGTFLSYFLLMNGQSFMVIDEERKNSPSRIAAGVINPVTGRRMVQVWLADEVLPFAYEQYREIGHLLDIECISQKNIIDYFPNPFMRENFLKREKENDGLLRLHESVDRDYSIQFNFDFGYGEIHPVYLSRPDILLPAWRKELLNRNCIKTERFEADLLNVTSERIEYQGITADNIIFCDGIESYNNKYFRSLPFAPNKGEALIIRIPGLRSDKIFKKSLLLAPLTDDFFWAGSNYLWDFDNDLPSPAFRERTEQQMKEWVKIPFTIEDHLAGIRPATIERRPFVGMHPINSRVGILNGMGTKGCSLGPYFAKQLCDYLIKGKPVSKEADIIRFRNLLSR